MNIRRMVKIYEIQYRIYVDGRFEKEETKMIESLSASDAVAMFKFWADGKERTWGCEIAGAKIEFKGFIDDACKMR